MFALNYLYFAIYTFVGIRFLTTKQKLVTNPLNHRQKLLFDGPELFWTLTFSTGLLGFYAPVIGMNLSAIRLLVLELFCLAGLFLYVKNKPVWSPCALFYLLYMVWIVAGLSYAPAKDYGFRVILKYLYPFMIMVFASAAVRNREVFYKSGLWAVVIGAVVGAAWMSIPFILPYLWMLFGGVFIYGTAITIYYISMCVFCLALFFYAGRKKLYLALAVLFVVPCIVWVFRTSIMGTTLALMTFFFFKYKLKSLPVIACILLLFILAVFFIPSVKEKMFNSKDTDVSQLQNNELSFDDINSNARFYMWETLMNKLYEDSMLTGSGTGAVQNYMYSNTVFGGLKAPHNDYVQILCDNGLIGLVLFLLAGFGAILHSFVEYNRRNVPASIKICAITAGSSMFGVLLTMLTDNTVNYSLATLAYPFGFYGMMLGLKKNKE